MVKFTASADEKRTRFFWNRIQPSAVYWIENDKKDKLIAFALLQSPTAFKSYAKHFNISVFKEKTFWIEFIEQADDFSAITTLGTDLIVPSGRCFSSLQLGLNFALDDPLLMAKFVEKGWHIVWPKFSNHPSASFSYMKTNKTNEEMVEILQTHPELFPCFMLLTGTEEDMALTRKVFFGKNLHLFRHYHRWLSQRIPSREKLALLKEAKALMDDIAELSSPVIW